MGVAFTAVGARDGMKWNWVREVGVSWCRKEV